MMEAFLLVVLDSLPCLSRPAKTRHHSTDNKHVGAQPVNHQVCALAPSECIDT